ncbi:MAG: hypothetical protein ACRBB0_24575 [Pelagimonas sp.]|uniref:hypothetical protein n=1 Tax=Pelagimonas sp. TaxID=2073170 RepID=UPI003D6A478C
MTSMIAISAVSGFVLTLLCARLFGAWLAVALMIAAIATIALSGGVFGGTNWHHLARIGSAIAFGLAGILGLMFGKTWRDRSD